MTTQPDLWLPDTSRYIYQKELCPSTNKLHYQGYVEFNKVLALSALKKLDATAHWENRRLSKRAAYDYCRKEDSRIEDPVFNFTVDAVKPGARSDLAEARVAILGKRTLAECYQDDDLNSVLAKYPQWVAGIRASRVIPIEENVVLYPWQNNLLLDLLETPHPRHIHWIFDKKGNSGKSFLANHLAANHAALILSNGKSSDIAHVYDNQRIVCWDLSRSQERFVNYGPMEDMKNGRIFSPKYGSCVKHFDVPHVVVFANFACPSGVFSEDRLQLVTLPLVNDLNPAETTADYIARLKRVKVARELAAASVAVDFAELKTRIPSNPFVVY